ncbi:MAG: hypothetical protein H7067_11515 [Burkholderiales bacterium]|nr:hypothetical protein [Opitutaceae bacterium]
MKLRLTLGALGAAMSLFASSAQAAVTRVLYVGNVGTVAVPTLNTEYQTFITTEYPGATWVQKGTGTTGNDTIGGDLDRTAVYDTVSQTLKTYLQSFDLIIVGVPTTSGNFIDGVLGADWAAINKPVLFQSFVTARALGGRPGIFGPTNSDNTVAAFAYTPAAECVRVSTSALSDRLLAGTTLTTDPVTSVSTAHLYAATSMDTMNNIATTGTGERIVNFTNGTLTHYGIVYWTAGSTTGTGLTLAANRAFMPIKTASLVDLNADGRIFLKNLINELTTPTVTIFLPPSGLTATGGIGQVSLAWSAPDGAVSYNVKRGTTAGGPYTTLATGVTATTYLDTAVTNGTSYYYVVSAVNSSAVESGNSTEAFALPVAFIQPAKKILYVANGDSADYKTFATTGQFSANTWVFKPTGLTGNDTVGGDLDRLADFTGINGATGGTVRAYLQSFDIIILGISTTSGNFSDNTTLADGTDWNSLTKPVLIHASFVIRALNSRIGLFSGDNTLTFTHGNPADSVRVSVSALGDAILAGVTDPTNLYVLTQSDTINAFATFGNGEVITRLTDGVVSHYGITFWAAGATSPLNHPIAANRAFLPLKGNINDLTPDGKLALTNLFNQMFVTQPVPPPLLTVPTNLTATANGATVDLAWGASIGVSTYSIKRATVSGGPYTTLSAGVVNALTYNDASAVAGTPYFYVVSAVSTTPAESANSNEATITLVAPVSAVESWRQLKFGPTATNTGDAADSADPDFDGRSNLIEYATGTEPLTADTGPAAILDQAAGKLTLTFTRIADPALTYTVRGSSDLTAVWSETPVLTSTGAGNTAGSVTAEDSVAITAQPRRFLRLEVAY